MSLSSVSRFALTARHQSGITQSGISATVGSSIAAHGISGGSRVAVAASMEAAAAGVQGGAGELVFYPPREVV